MSTSTQQRHKTAAVDVGGVVVGGGAPIVVQSMTNTDTADVEGTARQVAALAAAGSELVRITVDRDEAAAAVPHIRDRLAQLGVNVPLVGDFHYIGHKLLADHPGCAEALGKYRINPGNVGFKDKRTGNSRAIIEMALNYNKPVRIGANWGSLDQELLTRLMDENAKTAAAARCARSHARGDGAVGGDVSCPRGRDRPGEEPHHTVGQGLGGAGSDCGLWGARAALRLRDPSRPYRSRHGVEGHRRVLGRHGRAAATGHRRHHPRFAHAGAERRPHGEVKVAQELLQTMGLRTSCRWSRHVPAAGAPPRPRSRSWRVDIQNFIHTSMPEWKTRYPGVEALNVAVMGCIVNGPGESKHADIGISLPGTGEAPAAPVFVDGKKSVTLRGPTSPRISRRW